MSSSKPSQENITGVARERGRSASRRAHGRGNRRAGAHIRRDARGLAGEFADVGSEHAAEAVEIAKDLAALMLRAAVTIADGLVGTAEQLESVLTGLPSDDENHGSPGSGDQPLTAAPPALKLPDVSPGGEAAGDFVVRNTGLDTVDAMRVRCPGLFATGGLHISGDRVEFEPPSVDVPPHQTMAVTCTVRVPRASKRGQYSGLIEARDRPEVRLLVSLNVI
jgi:hypothetical protein